MTTPADPPPPMSYYSPTPNPRPTSVTVIAIIGIVLGSLGVLCSPFAVIPYVMKFGPPNPAIEIVTRSTANMAFMFTTMAIGFLNAILLLFASIACLKLKPWGRKGMIVYAAVGLLGVVAGLIFDIIVLFPGLAAARSTPGGPAAFEGGVIGGMGGVVIGLALPVAVLIIMWRPNVVAAFQHGGDAGSGSR